MKRIHYATISDSILNNDIHEKEVGDWDTGNSEMYIILRNKFGVKNLDEQYPNWILIVSNDTVHYTRDIAKVPMIVRWVLMEEDDVHVFEFETLKDVTNYLISYHAGIDYGLDELNC